MAETGFHFDSDLGFDHDYLYSADEILSRKRSFDAIVSATNELKRENKFSVTNKKHKLCNNLNPVIESKNIYPSPAQRGVRRLIPSHLDETVPYFYEGCSTTSLTYESDKEVVENVTVTPPLPSTRQRNNYRLESKKVRFKNVDVFFFPRTQSFDTVPSKGGAALGMGKKHNDVKRLSIAEYETEIVSNQACWEFKKNQFRDDEYSSKKFSYALHDVDLTVNADGDGVNEKSFEEYDCHFFSPTAFYKCPLNEKARRRLLRASGVQVDKNDRVSCNIIRTSRETCGCSCMDGVCIPSVCECIKEEICCQNERPYFPCHCNVDSCENPFGFVEFNPDRVRSHQTSVFIRLKKFPNCFEINTPKHVYFGNSRVRSTYLPLTPVMDGSSVDDMESLINNNLEGEKNGYLMNNSSSSTNFSDSEGFPHSFTENSATLSLEK